MDWSRFRAFNEGTGPSEVLTTEMGPKSGGVGKRVPPITTDLGPSDQGAPATFVV